MSLNAKRKGNKGELDFSAWLRDNGIKGFKDGKSGGGTSEKADIINGLNCHFEVKTVKKINLLQVWKKAVFECVKTHNTPVLTIRFDEMPKDQWLMVIHSETWLDLIKQQADVKIEKAYEDPKKKWNIKNLIESAKKVLKDFEE